MAELNYPKIKEFILHGEGSRIVRSRGHRQVEGVDVSRYHYYQVNQSSLLVLIRFTRAEGDSGWVGVAMKGCVCNGRIRNSILAAQ